MRIGLSRAEILYVEDSPADIELLREALAEYPELSVGAVGDGAEALALSRRRGATGYTPRPDLILLDLNLPFVDGTTVLCELKRDPALRVIPVVVLSSSSRQEDFVRAYELGANAYVTKPAGLDQFRAVARAVCEFSCGAAAATNEACAIRGNSERCGSLGTRNACRMRSIPWSRILAPSRSSRCSSRTTRPTPS